MHPGEQTDRKTQMEHKHRDPLPGTSVHLGPHPSGDTTPWKRQTTFLPPLHNSQAAAFPKPASQLQVFFKVKCHIYGSLYTFLNDFTRAKAL